jgi:acyl carrier protein
VAFRDQFEIDSMDFLNFIIALHEATGVDIPEVDYPLLETLGGCVAYIQEKGPA